MATRSPSTPLATLTFRLSVLGAMQEARVAEALAPLGLKPKHVALIGALQLRPTSSQQELARALRVAPSLLVLLADQLEQQAIIERVRDDTDRRRQRLELTEHGWATLARCVDLVSDLDAELTAGLTTTDRTALARILRKLADAHGLPTDS
jgi:DNA-binding MarR family transcriptional regulator